MTFNKTQFIADLLPVLNGEVMRSLNIVDHSFPLILNNPLRNPGLVLECIRNKVMQQHLGVFQGKWNYSICFDLDYHNDDEYTHE